MSNTQVNAANILLRKVMPDLAAVEHSGEMKVNYDIHPEPPATTEDWLAKHGKPRELDS